MAPVPCIFQNIRRTVKVERYVQSSFNIEPVGLASIFDDLGTSSTKNPSSFDKLQCIYMVSSMLILPGPFSPSPTPQNQQMRCFDRNFNLLQML
jgi:hypothetical protein